MPVCYAKHAEMCFEGFSLWRPSNVKKAVVQDTQLLSAGHRRVVTFQQMSGEELCVEKTKNNQTGLK